MLDSIYCNAPRHSAAQGALVRKKVTAVSSTKDYVPGCDDCLHDFLNKLPEELVRQILSLALSHLLPHEVVLLTMRRQGGVMLEAWPALCLQFPWLFPHYVSTPLEFRALIEDAQTYGRKTFKQIFDGLNLLQENTKKMEVADLHRGGLLKKGWLYAFDAGLGEEAEKQFLSWLQVHHARTLACLRWFPTQIETTDLLEEAAKYKNVDIFKAIFEYPLKHNISWEAQSYKRALKHIACRGDIEMAHYLLDKCDKNKDVNLDDGFLHIAAEAGSLEIVKMLLQKGVKLDASYYRETVTEVLGRIISTYFLCESFNNTPFHQMMVKQLEILVYVAQMGIENGIPENAPFYTALKPYVSGILHRVGYLPPEQGLWLTQFLMENGAEIKAKNSYANTFLHNCIRLFSTLILFPHTCYIFCWNWINYCIAVLQRLQSEQTPILH